MKRLDLTGDRPLTLRDCRKLKNWWQSNGWSCTITRVRSRYFGVLAFRMRDENV